MDVEEYVYRGFGTRMGTFQEVNEWFSKSFAATMMKVECFICAQHKTWCFSNTSLSDRDVVKYDHVVHGKIQLSNSVGQAGFSHGPTS